MRRSRFGLAVWCAVVAVVSLAAGPGPGPKDLEQNRRLLAKWREDPEHYQRLEHDLRAFWALPPAERDRLRRLDHDLHALDEKTQKRLLAVMDRYAAWLEHLPPEDRQRVQAAPDRAARIQVIREIRQRQWEEHLPRAVRERLAKLPDAERAREAARLREQERQNRKDWQLPLRPARLADFPADVGDFMRGKVLRRLTQPEWQHFRAAGGKPWPQLARAILTLVEKHPVLPPPPPDRPTIKRPQDIPAALRPLLPVPELRAKLGPRLREVNNKWPDFALAYVEVYKELHDGKPPPVALGACRPGEFPKEVQTFLAGELLPRLKPAEKKQLHDAEGRWPDYPLLLLRLGREHRLVVPGMSLPGPRELWDVVRAAK